MESTNSTSINSLPDESLLNILGYLDETSLHNTSMVSKLFRELSKDNSLWVAHAAKRNIVLSNGDTSLEKCVRSYIQKYCQYFMSRDLVPAEIKSLESDAFEFKNKITPDLLAKKDRLLELLETQIKIPGSIERIRMLIEAGAQPTSETLQRTISSSITYKNFPTLEITELLVNAGAKANNATLNFVMKHYPESTPQIVSLLLNAGANPSLEIHNALMKCGSLVGSPDDPTTLETLKIIIEACKTLRIDTLNSAVYALVSPEIILMLIESGAVVTSDVLEKMRNEPLYNDIVNSIKVTPRSRSYEV